MPHLIAALVLMCVSGAVPAFLLISIDLSAYADVLILCRRIGESIPRCVRGANEAAVTTAISALLGIGILLLCPPPKKYLRVRSIPDGVPFIAMASVIVAFAVGSVAFEALSPLSVFREEQFRRASSLISIGNLLWPLCLQFASLATDLRSRVMFLGLALPILAISPFRGVLFAIAVFGLIVPTLMVLRARPKRMVSIVIISIIGLTSLIIAETIARRTNLVLKEDNWFYETKQKLTQRAIIPVFQAHLATAYSIDPALPSITEEIAGKLRISSSLGVNGFLFTRLYNVVDAPGEATSLFYGEAAVRSAAPPLVWTVTAPITLIAMWACLRLIGLEAGTLLGIALWRGSLGGFVSILPALVIQLTMLSVCTMVARRGKKDL